VCGALFLFGFLGFKSAYLRDYIKTTKTGTNESLSIANGRGMIEEEKVTRSGNQEVVEKIQRIDPLEIVGIALFCGAFLSLTLAFGSIGLHFYVTDSIPAANRQQG
jgi:hypothetical protein